MKYLLSKINNTRLKGSVLALAVAALATAAQADVVYVTSYVGGTLTTCPTLCDLAPGGGFSTFGSTALSTAPGIPARTKTVYGYNTALTWSITPTLGVAGGVYKIDVAHAIATGSADVLVTATSSDGALSPSCANSPVYNTSYAANAWHHLGYITNNPGITQPKVTFAVSGGACGPTTGANRLYIDGFRFTEVNPCLGVAPLVSIGGPLAAGQTYVNVLGVDAGASSVKVYENGNQIGVLNAPNILAGSNAVPVTALNFSSEIKATQTKSGCTSDLPGSGPVVGGGPNPRIKASLSLWKVASLTGPIGATTTNNVSTNYILKASALSQGSQSAPIGGQPVDPGQCWQTVTFDHATDPAIYPNNGFIATFDPFCALDALVFAIDFEAGSDTGPFDIYVDRIMNGDVVVENFESYTDGGVGLFRAPNWAATPNPASTYLSAPNSSVVSTVNSYDGTNSARIRWQWADNAISRWARISANATAGKVYPQLDTTKPITIRYLVLPVGQTQDKLSFPTVPVSQTKSIGENVTLTVAAAGDAPYTYQWKYEGTDIVGATTTSLTKNNLQESDTGLYSVAVTGATCSDTVTAKLTVVLLPPTLAYSVSAGKITFTWSGGFTLQSKSLIDPGTWTDVSATSGYQENLNSSTTKFFRLRSN